MDLPATCPYCDSDQVTYTYVPRDPADNGTLVFTCTNCGSHVESAIANFGPAANGLRAIPHAIPTRRLADGNVADYTPQHLTAPQRS